MIDRPLLPLWKKDTRTGDYRMDNKIRAQFLGYLNRCTTDNLNELESMLRSALTHRRNQVIRGTMLGDTLTYRDTNGILEGIVTQINRSSVKVINDAGQTVTVPANRILGADTTADPDLQFSIDL